MKDYYDFSKGVKNPYAEKLRAEGYTVMINYGPTESDEGEPKEFDLLVNEPVSSTQYTMLNAATMKND